MNSAQKLLVEKALGWLAYLCMAVTCAILIWVLYKFSIDIDYRFERLIVELFSPSRGALFVWPPLGAGLILLWLRAFMRAGRG